MIDQDGADLVFVTGTPGSKWSAIAHALIYADGVNLSDISLERTHTTASRTYHFGNYFGPGMEYGRAFDRIDNLSKDAMLDELAAPFASPGGVKLIKSHMFARHLPRLAAMFPKARFLLVHRPDAACLAWWELAGGFSISFPDYRWYESSTNMQEQIRIDNAAIEGFVAARRGKLSRRRSMAPILAALGLSYSEERVREVADMEFERRFGFGGQPFEDVMRDCHAVARVAAVCVL